MNPTPSAAQLAEIKLLVPGIAKLINDAQLAVLATNMEVKDDNGVSLRDVLVFMVRDNATTTDNLVDLVRTINFRKLGPVIRQARATAIARSGYALQGVFSTTPGEADRAYTIGLSARAGFELIAYAGNDTNILETIVHSYATLALAGEDIEAPRNDLLSMRSNTKYGVRTVATAVADPETVVKEYLPGQPHKPTKVYQILIADKNNLLPNEQGYDPEWVQPVLA